MVGNDAIFKCSIPSFVTDFVFVESWIDSEANDLGEHLSGTFQHVSVYLNSVKDCLLISKFLVVHQGFETDVFKVNVILSNDILLKCVFPSHVSDLLSVLSWADSEGNTYTATSSYGKSRPLHVLSFSINSKIS